ncbi:class I SAM-dependent methyltransferase [Nitrosococcus oceani]|uniref:Phosphatidylethanolamine N-methyltransferase / phosphatidyl-N-methylethanolamine N-methyltransferase n=2 Tax=Nitrosococcus oceani TaxID=1229 RepID=Q3JCM0_NITOC|nr:class I SAM-dependent methyltransferase [Nitrosococcus oceani]KFI20118.1 SAM-dependent methlyltransferase [Nitrosococcus oceani C-27]ABA57426.1 phosphatidylethanolamine N-methyltransferase / phosphatidyl-N-methylethanolamine N-methyltransferase [Nitrosococcus oceani ATCC 19707]EDZ68284.1 methyltransferase, UbiE/COQ5 family [Nitrosococcus oceani AFC27]KFI23288.1 SAM-dependent methlyltransferase [Nitrosococcus oceani]GEM21451.1 phosphatidylethanolamine N-methyltransferase [Nitrosococcus ocean
MKKTTDKPNHLRSTTSQLEGFSKEERRQRSRLDIDAVQKAYKRYATLYDAWFGPIMQRGRKESIEKLTCLPGDKILEVGVGTGLSLPLYPPFVRITGIDISPEMLDRANARKKRLGLENVVELRVMDAEYMEFPDNSFDKVTATYVASVVPHPGRLVDELKRVCKPDGEIFILNHFQSTNPVLAGMERLLSPLSRFLGFHPDLCLDSFVKETDLEVIDITSTNLFGYWKLVRARNNKRLTGGVADQSTVKIVASQ